MRLHFRCPCGVILSAPSHGFGAAGECPNCGKIVIVPKDSVATVPHDSLKAYAPGAPAGAAVPEQFLPEELPAEEPTRAEATVVNMPLLEKAGVPGPTDLPADERAAEPDVLIEPELVAEAEPDDLRATPPAPVAPAAAVSRQVVRHTPPTGGPAPAVKGAPQKSGPGPAQPMQPLRPASARTAADLHGSGEGGRPRRPDSQAVRAALPGSGARPSVRTRAGARPDGPRRSGRRRRSASGRSSARSASASGRIGRRSGRTSRREAPIRPPEVECPECGEPIEEGELACPACGAEVVPDAEEVRPGSRRLMLFVVLLLLLVVGIAAAAFFLGRAL